jgi:hypothetical protein
MTEITPAASAGTEMTRFNALRHGVLSRYTVLPWENADEYQSLVAALVAEHSPQGPTEEHLVEEIAGILWRKRRLRLAESAAHRRGLEGTLASYRETVKVALVHLDTTGQSARVVDAIRATAADTEDDVREMQDDEAMTRRALDLLGSRCNDRYATACQRDHSGDREAGAYPGADCNPRMRARPSADAPQGHREEESSVDVFDRDRTGHCRRHDTRGLLSPIRQPAAGGRLSRSCNESSRQRRCGAIPGDLASRARPSARDHNPGGLALAQAPAKECNHPLVCVANCRTERAYPTDHNRCRCAQIGDRAVALP